MALPLERTLAEASAEVLARCNLGTPETAGADVVALVQAAIRQAQQQIYLEAQWAVSRLTTTIAMLDGVSEYDWPDTVRPERISQVSAFTSSYEWRVNRIIYPEDRSLALATYGLYAPAKYDYRDGIIEVWPTPSGSTLATLRIEYWQALTPLVNDADRLTCGSEAVVLLASALTIRHYRPAMEQMFMTDYARHITMIKNMQSPGSATWRLNQWEDGEDTRSARSRPWWLANRRP